MTNFEFLKQTNNCDDTMTPYQMAKDLITVEKAPFRYSESGEITYYYPVLTTSDGMKFAIATDPLLHEGRNENGFPTSLTAAIDHELEWLAQPHYEPQELIKCRNCKHYSDNYLGLPKTPGCPYIDECFGYCDFVSRVDKSVPYEEHKFYCEKDQNTSFLAKKQRKTTKNSKKTLKNTVK